MVEHGATILVTARRGPRELEAQTSIKRGYLNLIHAREAIARHALEAQDLEADGRAPSEPVAGAPDDRTETTPSSGILGRHHYPLWCETTGERCAAPNAASGRPASSTRATSMIRPPSGAAASAPRARCGSRPTSGSRPPGWSSSSATASRQEFDRDRLVSGLRKALTRRPVPDGAAEAAADAIEAELRAAGVTEVPSSRIGALAMEQLRGIDQIAYIRFASVYQSFEDLEALKREVDTLYAERGDTSRSTCAQGRGALAR